VRVEVQYLMVSMSTSWASVGDAGQVARRARGLTAAVVTAADGGGGGCEVQVELQRAIHPDDGGSGVGE
jgi:hypothetical protein